MNNDLDLNKSAALPESSGSTDGASGGSLGDATMADLKTGFIPEKNYSDANTDPVLNTYAPEPDSGFLNRPHGWER